ncbi:MAG: thioredoxin family protein [Patescibacteria group bacterium]
MNKTTGIIIGVVVVVLIAGGMYASVNKGDDGMMDASLKAKDEDQMMKDDPITQDGKTNTVDESDKMMKAGSYEAYAPEKLARAETGDVVLFFHASWCPSCRGLNSDIEKNLSAIPPEVSILKVDYDTESALKKKYGVTYQHTLVQVDADGAMIKKWSGSPTLSSLVSQIN